MPSATTGSLSFYGTGFRGANLDNVTCSIDFVPVPALYAGPQGIPGLDQINVRLLPEVLQGPNLWWFPNGELASGLAVTIRINGVVANYAEIR